MEQGKKAAVPSPEKAHRLIRFGKYDWRVLEERDGRMLLLTDKVIDYRRYHEPKKNITWEKCELRQYLNGDFLAEFCEEERERILNTPIVNEDNPWYTPGVGGGDTEDRVFLLSVNELLRYFGDSGDLAHRKGWYWAGDPAIRTEKREYGPEEMLLRDGQGQFLYDRYNDARIAENLHNESSWWRLRSPGRRNIYTVVVNPIGAVILTGTPHQENGIRPAMWVRT